MDTKEERFEDACYRIAKNFRFSDFRQFARVKEGLALDEVDVDDIISNQAGDLMEQRVQMLLLWGKKHSNSTTELIQIEQNYRNNDEGFMILEERIYLFYKSRISGYSYIFHGEQNHGQDRKKKLAIKLLWPLDESVRDKVHDREAKNLMRLSSHQNIVSYISSGMIKLGKLDFRYIAMELCDTRNLFQYISNQEKPLESQIVVSYGFQLVAGVSHIHSHDMTHCDIKPHNLLLSLNHKYLKIADFGASLVQTSSPQQIGPRLSDEGFQAPEIYCKEPPTTKSDMYSVGLSLYFLWTNGRHPFGLDPNERITAIKKKANPSISHIVVEDRNGAEKLISQLLSPIPARRWTADEVLNEWPYHRRSVCTNPNENFPMEDSEHHMPDVPLKEHILLFSRTERCTYAYDPANPKGKLKKSQDIMDLMVTDTFSSVVIGDQVFVLTWIGYVYATVPSDKIPSWKKVESETIFLHGRYPTAAVLGDCIYLCGGGWEEGGYCSIRQLSLPKASDACEVYNVKSRSWNKISSMKQERRRCCVISSREYVFCIGGQTSNGTTLNSVERYDPGEDSWEDVAPMMIPRHSAAVIELQGNILALGGKNDSGCIAQVEKYDVSKNQWTAFRNMSRARSIFRACLWESKLYVVGGDGSGSEFPSGQSIELYCEEGDKWETIRHISGIQIESASSMSILLPSPPDP